MKPQDIVVLLKKITIHGRLLSARKLAEELNMSASNVSECLERCKVAQLVDKKKKMVNVLALQEFLVHGIQYVFPVIVGRVGRGISTYVNASPIKERISQNTENYVWHYVRGTARGQQIEPLYAGAVEAALKDEELYQLLVIVDTLRMGRAREKDIAIQELSERLKRYAENQ